MNRAPTNTALAYDVPSNLRTYIEVLLNTDCNDSSETLPPAGPASLDEGES